MARERLVKRREGNEIEFGRIVAFSDGVFAIAITLLVLSLNIPEHLPHGESLAKRCGTSGRTWSPTRSASP